MLVVVIIQFIMSLTASLMSMVYEILYARDFGTFTGVDLVASYGVTEFLLRFLRSFGSWFILFINVVPISLVVSLEMVKFFQGNMI